MYASSLIWTFYDLHEWIGISSKKYVERCRQIMVNLIIHNEQSVSQSFVFIMKFVACNKSKRRRMTSYSSVCGKLHWQMWHKEFHKYLKVYHQYLKNAKVHTHVCIYRYMVYIYPAGKSQTDLGKYKFETKNCSLKSN